MTVEEAIEREIKTAGYKKDAADRCRAKLNNPNFPWGRDWTKEQIEEKERNCIKEAEEHQQMAEWLKEFRELKEKATAKKVFQPFGTHSYKCPTCWKFVAHEVDDNCDLEATMAEYCPYCGQKLDWSEGKE